MAYNNQIPRATDLMSISQGQILGNFSAIDSGTTGTGFGFSRNHITMTDSTNGGLHHRVDYYQSTASPSITGFASSLYPFTNTYTELYYKNVHADIRMTNSSLLASNGEGMLPGGILVKAGQAIGPTKFTDVNFVTPFPTGVIAITATPTGNDSTQQCTVFNFSTSGFTIAASKVSLEVGWIAIGY